MNDELFVNGERIDVARYQKFHRRRMTLTLEALRRLGAKNLVELGGHPWVMTAALLDDGAFQLRASVSAEEVTNWPDDIGVTRREYRMHTPRGREAVFPNYSANLERTLFDISEQPDTVIACEIIEHLLRSPHIMLLNINRWLPVGGRLLLSTPNGAQFNNPFRCKTGRPAYRCNVYARHNYLFTLDQLVDLVQLCGFKVTASGYWNVYNRAGLSRVYSALGALPLPYFQEKFQRTLYVMAEKALDVKELLRLPKCYAPSANWELIRHAGAGAPSCAPQLDEG